MNCLVAAKLCLIFSSIGADITIEIDLTEACFQLVAVTVNLVWLLILWIYP